MAIVDYKLPKDPESQGAINQGCTRSGPTSQEEPVPAAP